MIVLDQGSKKQENSGGKERGAATTSPQTLTRNLYLRSLPSVSVAKNYPDAALNLLYFEGLNICRWRSIQIMSIIARAFKIHPYGRKCKAGDENCRHRGTLPSGLD